MSKPDIIELFGLPALDTNVAARIETKECPFTKSKCIQPKAQGVCVVSQGSTKIPVMICQNRFYGGEHAILKTVSSEIFGAAEFIIGGDRDELEEKLFDVGGFGVVAFGPDSFKPVSVQGKTKVEFNWIIQKYNSQKRPVSFVGVEIIPIDITGSYKNTLDGYREFHESGDKDIPPSEHGINWPSLTKKILPDLIKKGLILSATPKCEGIYAVMPEVVYQRIEHIFENLIDQNTPGSGILSIRTVSPDLQTVSGIKNIRAMNFNIKEMAAEFYGQVDDRASEKLERTLKDIIT